MVNITDICKAAYKGDMEVLQLGQNHALDFNGRATIMMINRHWRSFAFLGSVTPFACAVLGGQLQALNFIEKIEGVDIFTPIGRASDYTIFSYISELQKDGSHKRLPPKNVMTRLEKLIENVPDHKTNREAMNIKRVTKRGLQSGVGGALGGAAVGALAGGGAGALLGPLAIPGAAIGGIFGFVAGGVTGGTTGAAITYDKQKSVVATKHAVDDRDAAVTLANSLKNNAIIIESVNDNEQAIDENIEGSSLASEIHEEMSTMTMAQQLDIEQKVEKKRKKIVVLRKEISDHKSTISSLRGDVSVIDAEKEAQRSARQKADKAKNEYKMKYKNKKTELKEKVCAFNSLAAKKDLLNEDVSLLEDEIEVLENRLAEYSSTSKEKPRANAI